MAKIGGKGMGIIVAVVLLTGIGTHAYSGVLSGLFKKSPAEIGLAAGVVDTADALKIPLKALDSRKRRSLLRESEVRQVHYFALKSRDGAYRAALDACDVCYQSNRGYRQESDLMVCNNCGQTFPSNRIGEVKGGCNPHPLARRIDGQYLVIGKAGIVAGKEYFASKRP